MKARFRGGVLACVYRTAGRGGRRSLVAEKSPGIDRTLG